MLIVFTGNGKGKTTAALGQALRSVGDGKKVKMIQFIKSESYPSGEDESFKLLSPNFELVKGGIGFVGILGDKHTFSEHVEAAKKTLSICREAILSGKYDLVIMDEINNVLDLKLIQEKEVQDLLNQSPKNIDIICTGRNAPDWLISRADIVTEMREIKHAYNDGGVAKKGIEY